MPYRNNRLVTGNVYHVFSKSIAGFKIFNSVYEYDRMVKTIAFYRAKNTPCRLSAVLRPLVKQRIGDSVCVNTSEQIVAVVAYCFMPTHIHLVLKQLKEDGISQFMNVILKSYSKFFNAKYKRKGPLWEGRFKCVRVHTDEQLLHLVRYIHLNPVTAFLLDNPEDWKFSSYREYVGIIKDRNKICDYSEYFEMTATLYKNFVADQIDYQRQLAEIKHLIHE